MRADIECRELVEAVTDYIEGTLPDPERERFEAHLAECSYCEQYVEQMRRTIAALGEVSAESIAPESRDRLLAAFRGWRP